MWRCGTILDNQMSHACLALAPVHPLPRASMQTETTVAQRYSPLLPVRKARGIELTTIPLFAQTQFADCSYSPFILYVTPLTCFMTFTKANSLSLHIHIALRPTVQAHSLLSLHISQPFRSPHNTMPPTLVKITPDDPTAEVPALWVEFFDSCSAKAARSAKADIAILSTGSITSPRHPAPVLQTMLTSRQSE
jgi:hypothetical protein